MNFELSHQLTNSPSLQLLMSSTKRKTSNRIVGEIRELDDVCGNLRDAIAERHRVALFHQEQLTVARDDGGADGAVGPVIFGDAGELQRGERGTRDRRFDDRSRRWRRDRDDLRRARGAEREEIPAGLA